MPGDVDRRHRCVRVSHCKRVVIVSFSSSFSRLFFFLEGECGSRKIGSGGDTNGKGCDRNRGRRNGLGRVVEEE